MEVRSCWYRTVTRSKSSSDVSSTIGILGWIVCETSPSFASKGGGGGRKGKSHRRRRRDPKPRRPNRWQGGKHSYGYASRAGCIPIIKIANVPCIFRFDWNFSWRSRGINDRTTRHPVFFWRKELWQREKKLDIDLVSRNNNRRGGFHVYICKWHWIRFSGISVRVYLDTFSWSNYCIVMRTDMLQPNTSSHLPWSIWKQQIFFLTKIVQSLYYLRNTQEDETDQSIWTTSVYKG